MDKAQLIEGYALDYERQIRAEGTRFTNEPPEPPFKDPCQLITLKQSKVPVRDACVVVLQRALSEWSLKNRYGLYPIKEDGLFGFDTKSRVITFQRINSLKPDGIVGPATWSKLEPYL